MKTYEIELNIEANQVNDRLNISKDFDNKMVCMLADIILRERKLDRSISCTDTILELKEICSNDNEFFYASMQIGRIFENTSIENSIIEIANSIKNIN